MELLENVPRSRKIPLIALLHILCCHVLSFSPCVTKLMWNPMTVLGPHLAFLHSGGMPEMYL